MINANNPTEQICNCCLGERRTKGQNGRALVPVYVQGNVKPYLICGHCDGDALIGAKALEQKPANE